MALVDQQKLTQFLAPGFLHGLGNSLFLIQGQAQLHESPGSEGILQACKQASLAMDLFRALSQEEQAEAKIGWSAEVLLESLCEMLRPGLRDQGLRLAYAGDGKGQFLQDSRAACLLVCAVLLQLQDELPTGFAGEIKVTLQAAEHGSLQIRIAINHDPSQLPFTVDLAQVARDLEGQVQALAGQLELQDGTLQFGLPTLDASSS